MFYNFVINYRSFLRGKKIKFYGVDREKKGKIKKEAAKTLLPPICRRFLKNPNSQISFLSSFPMASRCRSLASPTISLIKSTLTKPSIKPTPAFSFTVRSSPTTSRQARLFNPLLNPLLIFSHFLFYSSKIAKWDIWFVRLVPLLGSLQSLLPLHSAVSSARLTSCLGTDSVSSRSLSQGMLCSANPGVWFLHSL